MKNGFILAFFLIAFACNNKKKDAGGQTAPNITNVENVNGGVPDTTNGSTLNSTPAKDSSKIKDSLLH